ncbi:spc98 like protein [Dissoconium aciculare CBS 342.82]|uniref:Spc98 like protein n=1 Tax=Dissoconium aciculare CBS 342.82 TaxID=1314786 RepID=A0A6J3MFE6_9PEZI|nr:spc98 like protein [Dissoconium aciculare CBS 342.82]KAF1825597.1 spc98 like protein [Dissoconium aciculare CBS 342.82]
MSTSKSERIENALQSLLERLVPGQQPEEDEDVADQRWDDASALATAILRRGGSEAAPAEDVNHAAELIRRKLLRDNSGPEKAAAFSNLYSRLLAQPILTKRWAILYFLLKMGEDGEERHTTAAAASRSIPASSASRALPAHSEQELGRSQTAGRPSQNDQAQYEGRNPVFDTAFSRNGLPRVQNGQARESPMPTTPRERERPMPPRTRGQEKEPATPEPVVKKPVDGPTELALLRDLPFTLQGLSSTHLLFAQKQSLKLPSTIPVPLVSLLHTLAEPSLLYQSLSEFVESSEGGLVGQSLRAAIAIELRSYLSLVATLEGQIRRALTQIEENPSTNLNQAGVTLKRCVVWTREATLGLRLMSAIVVSAEGKKGGELISLIHNFASSHGDPFVHTFAERLLTQITRPFYNMLRAWVYDGELEDPYLEFFVSENPDHEDSGATSVWEHKYLLQENMIPSIMTADFANKVFLIGKSLNFIRYGCADSVWVENYSKSTSRELKYGDNATLSLSIDEAYKTVMERLISLMETKFALFSHLQALKKYLLLGQGDFIALLMESLSSNLDRPANSQYRHTLTAQLEHAIRNSNAQFDSPDVLRRLDARMLELSHGEIGWDVFTLEYRIDSPLDVIVTPWASKQYLKVFNFLWRVKRVEFALSTTWRRVQTGARGVISAVEDKLGADWKSARGGVAEMIHFINQLQYYILFEVIEAGWEGLQKAMRKPDATLDTLISAHTTYLRSITRKGLLGGGVSGAVDFTAQLHELLKLMLAYRDAVDSLYSFSVAEYSRRQELAAKIETRTRAGRWGITEADELDSAAASPLFTSTAPGNKSRTRNKHDSDDLSSTRPLLPLHTGGSGIEGERGMLEQLRQRLKTLETDFRARVNVLLGDLAYQPDVDMRFLAVVMNFNDVYAPVKRRRQHKPATSAASVAATGSVAGSVRGTQRADSIKA